MPLARLLNQDSHASQASQASQASSQEEVMIYGLTADSRQVRPGWLFAALSGVNVEGADYVPDALKRGASAVLAQSGFALPHEMVPAAANVALVTDPNPRRLFAYMAARFHQDRPPIATAVTGTNGKTSVAMFTRHIWTMLGHRAASIGTLGVVAGGHSFASPLTTPSADIVHRILAGLARRKFTHVMLEASSHGLAQYRLDGVHLMAAVFTGLGEDHMDYHQSRAEYLAAKLRLVREVLPEESVFVCDDEAAGAAEAIRAARSARHRLLRVGGARAEIHLRECRAVRRGQMISMTYEGRPYEIMFPLVARFQAMNALMAAACVIGVDRVDPARVFAALETMPHVPGRLEEAGRTDEGAPIYIDYAHTPDALKAALGALRKPKGRLIIVFGCGGDRDQSKRPRMGRIARDLADHVIVTDDNPRFEDAAAIRAEIMKACPDADNIGDRAEAIGAAIKMLGADDVLLVAGKGHERYQERQGRFTDFSDADIVREIVREILS